MTTSKKLLGISTPKCPNRKKSKAWKRLLKTLPPKAWFSRQIKCKICGKTFMDEYLFKLHRVKDEAIPSDEVIITE